LISKKGEAMKGAKVISKGEINKLLAAARDARERVLVICGLYLGTRVSETAALTFGDFSGEYIRIRSVKNSNDRQLAIPEELRREVDHLRSYYIERGCIVEEDTPLFLSQKKDQAGHCRPLARESVCRILKNMRDRAGLDERVSHHSFRKCFSTKLHELCGHNLPQLAVYTGHKSIDSLRAYIETTQETNLTQRLRWI
jgi:integrase